FAIDSKSSHVSAQNSQPTTVSRIPSLSPAKMVDPHRWQGIFCAARWSLVIVLVSDELDSAPLSACEHLYGHLVWTQHENRMIRDSQVQVTAQVELEEPLTGVAIGHRNCHNCLAHVSPPHRAVGSRSPWRHSPAGKHGSVPERAHP